MGTFAGVAVFLFASNFEAVKTSGSIIDLLNDDPFPKEAEMRFVQIQDDAQAKEEKAPAKKLDQDKVEVAKEKAKVSKSKEEKDRANLRKGKNTTVITSMLSVHRDKLHPGAFKDMNEK